MNEYIRGRGCENGSCVKPPVDHDNLYTPKEFVEELKKQIPGLKLDQSHIYKTAKLIEKILDESQSL